MPCSWGQRLYPEAMGAGRVQRAQRGDDTSALLGTQGEGAAPILLQQREEGAGTEGTARGQAQDVTASGDTEGQREQDVAQHRGAICAAVRGAVAKAHPAPQGHSGASRSSQGCPEHSTSRSGTVWAPHNPTG